MKASTVKSLQTAQQEIEHILDTNSKLDFSSKYNLLEALKAIDAARWAMSLS